MIRPRLLYAAAVETAKGLDKFGTYTSPYPLAQDGNWTLTVSVALCRPAHTCAWHFPQISSATVGCTMDRNVTIERSSRLAESALPLLVPAASSPEPRTVLYSSHRSLFAVCVQDVSVHQEHLSAVSNCLPWQPPEEAARIATHERAWIR